jgi:hypothetical protein
MSAGLQRAGLACGRGTNVVLWRRIRKNCPAGGNRKGGYA